MSLVRDIDLDLLDMRPDARNLDAKQIEPLAHSIAESGLIHPIRVREIAGGRFEVVAGAHRVAAHRLLGLAEIPALVAYDDDPHAELAMIDENLCRAELTPVDRAHQIARRKEIYELLHPETRHGGDRKSGDRKSGAPTAGVADQVDKLSTRSFADETAALTGRDARSVRRDAERGAKVSDKVLDLIRVTPLNSGAFLDRIKNLSPAEQMRAAKAELAELSRMEVERRRMRAEAKKHARELREKQLAEKQQALPDKKYGVIYADPEWRFEPLSSATGMGRAADNHYPTSDLADIKARPVGDIAASDCVLFLWATVPMLPQALEVMAAWGFAYKSHLVWFKGKTGTGYWFRNQHELLLVGTRGNIVAPAPGTQWGSLHEWARGRHSEKPAQSYGLVEAYFPNLPKIELNARQKRDGWDVWGLEAPQEDQNLPETANSSASVKSNSGTGSARDASVTPHPEGEDGPTAIALQVGTAVTAGETAPLSSAEAPSGGGLVHQGHEAYGRMAGAAPDQGQGNLSPEQQNEMIRAAYAAGAVDLKALAQKTGLNTNSIKQRAKRRGWGNRDNQRAATIRAHAARGNKEGGA